MMHLQHDIACCFLVLFILSLAEANFQDYLNVEQKSLHSPEKKFAFSEYLEDTGNNERNRRPLTARWGQIPLLYPTGHIPKSTINSELMVSDEPDKNIVLDSHWAENIKFGQITAVSIDPNGNIAIFHRGSRTWGISTFNYDNTFDRTLGPIQENTVILLDKSGKKLLEWGANMFYMPHGLTVDMHGNYWITDVALHQVLKFDAKDIALMKDMAKLRRRRYKLEAIDPTNRNSDNLFENYMPKPSLILGRAFEPGNDQQRFCKPTAVAVQSDGDFFVSDGYCNSRVIKFNADGEPILQWGRRWGIDGNTYQQSPPPNAFNTPHALALASELNLIFVADRENGRVVSFYATNGTFHKEYKHHLIGNKIYSVAYARGRLYLVNGSDLEGVHIRGFILDVNSGDIITQFWPAPRDMDRPHDMAVSEDGSEIYVVELNLQIAYRFLQDINESTQTGNSVVRTYPHHEPAPLTDTDISNPTGGTTTATLVLSLVTAAVIFIALCVAIAAVVARCQKRGCLLIMHKRMRWEAERREKFKLSSLLENRRGKNFKITEKRPNPRDFSKLNTEPETSEDEYPENSLTKVI